MATENTKDPVDSKPENVNFGEGHKILIADDDPTTIEIVKGILSKVGFEVLTATDGKDAWEKIKPDSSPILIISDVLMPEMDGFTLFKELKKNEEAKKIPVMILTSRKNMESSFLALGADDFIAKPINADDFLEKVKNLSGRGIASQLSAESTPENKESKSSDKEA